MAENRKGKDKRLYFSRGQLVLLGGAFTLASIIIFFLGVFVGKDIEERKMVKKEEPLVKIPVKPSAPGSAGAQVGQPKEELTFYDTLTRSPAAQPLVEGKPKETKPPEKMAKAEVKESKPPAKEEASPPKAKDKPVEKAVSAAQAPKKTPVAEAAESKEKDKGWTVQVNAFPEEKSGKLLVDRLKNKGYNAYVTEVRNRGKIWYRVRVGSYASREEAKKVEQTLKTKENYTRAFTTTR